MKAAQKLNHYLTKLFPISPNILNTVEKGSSELCTGI